MCVCVCVCVFARGLRRHRVLVVCGRGCCCAVPVLLVAIWTPVVLRGLTGVDFCFVGLDELALFGKAPACRTSPTPPLPSG